MKLTKHRTETWWKGTEFEFKTGRDLSIRMNSKEQLAINKALRQWKKNEPYSEQREIIEEFMGKIFEGWA